MFSSYLIVFSAFVALASSSQDVTGFYPQVKGNLTWITWAHDCQPPLNNASVMMFSENITSAKIGKNTVPVLNTNKSVQLYDLLESLAVGNTYYNVSLGQGKGIKLQFSDADTLSKSLSMIGAHAKIHDYPLVIAADTVDGTNKATLNSATFFDVLSKSKFNLKGKVILSLGWVIDKCIPGYPDAALKQLWNDVKAEQDYVYNIPIRACAVGGTNSTFKELVNNFTHSSVTVYSLPNDTVKVADVRKFVLDIGVNRTFLDVPQDLRDKLRLDQHHGDSGDSGAFRTLSTSTVVVLSALFLRFML